MTPMKRNGIFQLYVPKQTGRTVERSTGTKDPLVYRGMKRMLVELKDKRRWTLLTAATQNVPGKRTPKLSLGRLYDAYAANALDALEASLSASALAPHALAYIRDCRARGLAPRNVENVTRQLNAFLRFVPGTTADLTTANVTAWLASLKTSPGTRRQYLYAVTGFARYLCDQEVLKDYPLSRVKAPKKNKARMRYVDTATDERIVQAARADVRALFAFVKGTGCDLSTALEIERGDINLAHGTARLKGTKTAERDVHKALIEPWALPYLSDALRGELPYAKPWVYVTRSIAAKQHSAACTAVKVKGYTLKDSRHSVAVRMMEAGYNVQEIAEQLGNSPELVAKVYSKFAPKMTRRATAETTSEKKA